MTQAQVSSLRKQINAAWNNNDKTEAERLTNILRSHTTKQAEQFVKSEAGQAWTNEYMMNRP